MSDNKKSNKVRLVLRIFFALVAIGALVVAILISPLGAKLRGNKDNTTTTQVQVVETTTEKTEPSTEEKNEEDTSIAGESAENTDTSVTIPPPTQEQENIYKNYTLFINTYDFTYTESKGVTTVVRKDNADITMVITPTGETSYLELCDTAKASLGDEDTDKKLPIQSLNSCYSSQNGETVTTIYCIDDGKGGSIEVKCQYPASDEKAEGQFQLMLSMFKVTK